MEPATTQSIYYLVAGGCALLAAVIMLIVRIESHGRWKGEMDAHKAEMTEHKATVAKFMEEIRDRLTEVFDRLPPVPVTGGSTLRLTKLAESSPDAATRSRHPSETPGPETLLLPGCSVQANGDYGS